MKSALEIENERVEALKQIRELQAKRAVLKKGLDAVKSEQLDLDRKKHTISQDLGQNTIEINDLKLKAEILRSEYWNSRNGM